MSLVEVHGYAIVSDDNCIADAQGAMPAALRNDADWEYFQRELDRSDLTVLGRLGHESNANPKGRRRMILSGSVPGLVLRGTEWWWNPALVPWEAAAAAALPRGGRVAVPGGRRVFDLFLASGYHAFHLARAEGVLVPGGVPLFSACHDGHGPEAILADRGLQPGAKQVIDPAGPVSLRIWSRTCAARPR